MKVKSLSRVRLPATPWTAAYQAPPFVHGILQTRVLEWVAIATKFRKRVVCFCYLHFLTFYCLLTHSSEASVPNLPRIALLIVISDLQAAKYKGQFLFCFTFWHSPSPRNTLSLRFQILCFTSFPPPSLNTPSPCL